jgi:hypothetical protein
MEVLMKLVQLDSPAPDTDILNLYGICQWCCDELVSHFSNASSCLKDLLSKINSAMKQMDLGEIGWDGMNWIDLAQEWTSGRALVNTVMNLHVP